MSKRKPRRAPATTAIPIVRTAFGVFDAQRKQLADIRHVAGTTVKEWRHGRRDPTLPAFLEFVDELGYELLMVEKRQ